MGEQTAAERHAWLEERRTGIGGSDIGILLGLSTYKSPYQLWEDKTGKVPVDDSMSEPARWGTILEPVVAQEYARQKGVKVQRVNKMMRHPEHSFACANIDRAVVNPEIAGNVRFKDGRLTTDRILEVKTASAFQRDRWGEEMTDQIPPLYLCQGIWYAGVTKTAYCDTAVLIGGQTFKRYETPADAAVFQRFLELAGKFWDQVQKDIPPDPRDYEDAKYIWPDHVPLKENIIGPADVLLVEKLRAQKAREKEIQAEIDETQTEISKLFGDAEALTHGGEKIATWKTQTSQRIDAKRLRKDFPLVAAEVATETQSRVMRLSKKKD